MKRIVFYLSIFIFLYLLNLSFAETLLAKTSYSDDLTVALEGFLHLIPYILLIIAILYGVAFLLDGSKIAIEKISKSIKDSKLRSKCPHCNTLYFITKKQIGKKTICDNCHNKFTIQEYIVLKTVD
jgi:predicted Zn finger-like uncharacterized protein